MLTDVFQIAVHELAQPLCLWMLHPAHLLKLTVHQPLIYKLPSSPQFPKTDDEGVGEEGGQYGTGFFITYTSKLQLSDNC